MEVIKRSVEQLDIQPDDGTIGFRCIMNERDWVTLVHKYRTGNMAAWHVFCPELSIEYVDLSDNGTMRMVQPVNFSDWSPQEKHIWTSLMQRCEKAYMMLVGNGMDPQEAKTVLPSNVAHVCTIVGSRAAWGLLFVHHQQCMFLRNFFKNILTTIFGAHENAKDN